jgi:hypothetical protein
MGGGSALVGRPVLDRRRHRALRDFRRSTYAGIEIIGGRISSPISRTSRLN